MNNEKIIKTSKDLMGTIVFYIVSGLILLAIARIIAIFPQQDQEGIAMVIGLIIACLLISGFRQ